MKYEIYEKYCECSVFYKLLWLLEGYFDRFKIEVSGTPIIDKGSVVVKYCDVEILKVENNKIYVCDDTFYFENPGIRRFPNIYFDVVLRCPSESNGVSLSKVVFALLRYVVRKNVGS